MTVRFDSLAIDAKFAGVNGPRTVRYIKTGPGHAVAAAGGVGQAVFQPHELVEPEHTWSMPSTVTHQRFEVLLVGDVFAMLAHPTVRLTKTGSHTAADSDEREMSIGPLGKVVPA